MKLFTEDFNQFYKDLAANNSRDWFHANKKRYENSVKKPFENFVSVLMDEIKKDDEHINTDVKQSIFRINRDVRFSNDKTPYKLHSSAVISRGGKKDYTVPGVYVQLGPEDVRIYGGIYMLDKLLLLKVREYIASNINEFEKVLNDSDFKKEFGTLQGEKNKIIPKELKEAGAKQPLIYNKSFYYFNKMNPDNVTKDSFLSDLMKKYYAGKKMKEFLTRAIF